MSEAGPLPLDLDYPSIYLFEVGADEKEGRRRFCRRTQEGGLGREGVREGGWREDLGGFPLPMQCHCRLQDPLTQVPSELENLPSALNRDFCKICFQLTWQRLIMGIGQKRQFVRKLAKEAKGKQMRFNNIP